MVPGAGDHILGTMPDEAPRDTRLRVVAIDGPVASGKTVIGKAVAERLRWPMLDTGIMYRALTWAALERGLLSDPDHADPALLTQLAETVRLRVDDPAAGSVETASIRVDEDDATPHLRSRAVEAAVSAVASVPGVRQQMVEQQKAIAIERSSTERGIVMVGRDIGTVVAPDALVKIYLDASAAVRAARRAAQMRAAGREVSEEEVRVDLEQRDAIDQGRATAPLRRAVGAERVNTSEDNLETAIERVLAIVRRELDGRVTAEGSPA